MGNINEQVYDACCSGNEALALRYMDDDSGEEINTLYISPGSSKLGNTMLMWAYINGCTQLANKLIQLGGSNPSYTNAYGHGEAHFAPC